MIRPIGNTPLLPGTLKNLFYPPEKNEYTYFARAKERPFSGGSDLVRAAWAADAAMLSYAHYGPQPMPDVDLVENLARGGLTLASKIGDWNAHGTQGFFAMSDSFAFLSFRGTEKEDPVDQLDDADLLLVHEPDYRPVPGESGPALAHLSRIEHLFSHPCLVHRGFQRALNRVWEQVHGTVTDYRSNHPNAEICFTGHSLGAALALLAFSRFDDAGNSLITFGCPRVGNAQFQTRAIEQPGKGMFRYVNLNDPVAHIPPESFFYKQAPERCWRFDSEGDLAEDDGSFKGDVAALRVTVEGLPTDFSAGLHTIDCPAGVVDHSPARYCIRLWNCV